MRDPAILVEDIQQSIQRIRDYVGHETEDEFLANRKTQAAVLWELIAIGEAAKRLPDDFRQRYSEMPWQDMVGTRDFLAHGYYRVDGALVWDIVKTICRQWKNSSIECDAN